MKQAFYPAQTFYNNEKRLFILQNHFSIMKQGFILSQSFWSLHRPDFTMANFNGLEILSSYKADFLSTGKYSDGQIYYRTQNHCLLTFYRQIF